MTIQGVVHLTLRFGNELMRHKFYVVNLPITTILRSDFFGQYKTLFNYGDLTYRPLGLEGPTLKMLDSSTVKQAPAEWRDARVSGVLHAEVSASTPPPHRAVCLQEDIIIPAHTEMNVEVALCPPVKGVRPYAAVIQPATTQTMMRLQERGIKTAMSVDTVGSHNPVRARMVISLTNLSWFPETP